MLGPQGGVDPHELAQLTAELEASGYHRALRDYVEARTVQLLVADLRDPHAVMKCRGQVEELQRLINPVFVQSLALSALAKRAEARAATDAAAATTRPPRRDWWNDPVDGEEPIP